MDTHRLIYLLTRQLNKTISPDEIRELDARILDPANQADLPETIQSLMEQYDLPAMEALPGWQQRIDQIVAIDQVTAPEMPGRQRVHFLRSPWLRYAALFLLIAGTVTFFYQINRPQQTITQKQPATNLPDIQPGSNKATLTLADGSIIGLDTAALGSLAQLGNTRFIKTDAGKLIYEGSVPGGITGYNTINTPKGGQYQIKLPDGTKVWLNASSSIRFPTAFHTDRTVEITGEAYLEVAPDNKKPFFVKNREALIQVLGTGFNINAYEDERAVKTSLLTGSIKIGSTILKPGEAFQAGAIVSTDVHQDIAWKDGIFDFEGLGMAALMRQVERWYDVTVIYQGTIPTIQFVGQVKRDVSLSDLLSILQQMGVNATQAPGRKIIITP